MKSPPTLSLSAKGLLPKLKQDKRGNYHLSLDISDQPLKIELNAEQLRALGLSCLRYFPDIETRFVIPAEEEAYRLSARRIGHLDDRSIQLLLREVQSESLILFLWYMRDPYVIKKFLKNISQQVTELLLEDLEAKFDELKDPDQAPLIVVESGRNEALYMVEVLERLQADGKIPKT